METFLPKAFFNVHQDTTPKAPVRTLIKWGMLVYVVITSIFVCLFLVEKLSAEKLTVTDTTILQEPVLNNPNIKCTDW